MAAKTIPGDDLGLPRFAVPAPVEGRQVFPFDFSSHKRAGQALRFSLS
ncbi:MAG: hypothetical protein IT562_17870, partial [Alphaproteobacteria bacterium]|nr:hypothetical protein [Alphaproteobacteria bacterium]